MKDEKRFGLDLYGLIMEAIKAFDQSGKFDVENCVSCNIVLPQYKVENLLSYHFPKYHKYSVSMTLWVDATIGTMDYHLARNHFKIKWIALTECDPQDQKADPFHWYCFILPGSPEYTAIMDRDAAQEPLYTIFRDIIMERKDMLDAESAKLV